MGPGDDVPPIGRVSNGIHTFSTLRRLANYSTSLGILAPNGVVPGSGDDVPSIRRVTSVSVPLYHQVADCSTSLSIPDTNCLVIGSMTLVCPIHCIGGAGHDLNRFCEPCAGDAR